MIILLFLVLFVYVVFECMCDVRLFTRVVFGDEVREAVVFFRVLLFF